jgi:DNA-binding NarL/FixJ family response regulator
MARAQKHISMVLVDHNPSSSEGVVALIRARPGFRVLAAKAEIEVALRKVRRVRPDLVLLNLPRVGEDRLMLAGALHGQSPESRVIIMGLLPRGEDVASLVRAGVWGFIMADAPFGTFLRTIHSVARGSYVLPLELARDLFSQLAGRTRRRSQRSPLLPPLTVREQSVTDLIIRGLNNRDIANRLGIALATVKARVQRVLAKLSVNSRLEVASFSRSRAKPRNGASPPLGTRSSPLLAPNSSL